tara:strand:- start:1200 stop:1604 length:405 start_codon:yes stop_codon:yes gene_type:complete
LKSAPLWNVAIPENSEVPSILNVIPIPDVGPTFTPDLAVTTPTESIFVTSSYVRTPVSVAATPIILLTVISGVPDNPPAVPETVPVTSPVKSPSKLVAVHTPVTTMPSGHVGEVPESLPLKLVTLKSDIRDLLC